MAVDNINQHKSFVQNRRSSLLAAIFLMATSAIGPGFITQTATFTATLGVALAFGIDVYKRQFSSGADGKASG